MTLTAPGAKAPVVSAENMRLDVKLLPLLSHQLFVKQVMLKNAVIRLTPDSEEHSQVDAPIAPAGSATDAADAAWKFDIDNLRVVDSLLIWQRADNEQINVRDINLTLQQTEKRRAQLELSSRVNRDQRDLIFSMAADVDLQQFPTSDWRQSDPVQLPTGGRGYSERRYSGERVMRRWSISRRRRRLPSAS